MKRVINTFVGLALAGCFVTSCGDEEGSVQASDMYTLTTIYDVGNTGNSSDIRVNFDLKIGTDLTKLSEVRLVLVRGSKSLSKQKAGSLSPGSFFTVPLQSGSHQSIKITADIKDSDAEPIINGEYTAFIVTLGTDNAIGISAGKKFALADKPVYAGDYVGVWEDLGPPGPGKFAMSMRIADNYSGKMFYANADFKPFGSGSQDALVTMTVNGTEISAFVLDQLIENYPNDPTGCAATKSLTGNFEDDINLVLDTFVWSDCDGSRQVKLKFTRQ